MMKSHSVGRFVVTASVVCVVLTVAGNVRAAKAQEAEKPSDGVTILGEVERPGWYPLKRGERLCVREWLLKVGIKSSADLNRVELRRAAGCEEPRLCYLLQWTEDEKRVGNIVVQPGDTIFVPAFVHPFFPALVRARGVTVSGAVARPGFLRTVDGTTLFEVIIQAGGALRSADLSRVEIVRANGTKVTVNLQDTIKRGDPWGNPVVEPGDSIFVPSLKGIRVFGAVQKPGTIYTYNRKVSVTDILKKAGGFLPNADLPKSQVIRENGEVVHADLEAILQGKQPGVDLQPGDTLQKLRGCGRHFPPSPSPSHKERGVTRAVMVGFFPQHKAFFAAETARGTPLPLWEGLGEGGRLWRQLRNF